MHKTSLLLTGCVLNILLGHMLLYENELSARQMHTFDCIPLRASYEVSASLDCG